MANANARINVDINTSEAAAGLKRLQSQLNAFNSTLTKGSAVQATAMRNAKDNLMELVNASRFFTAETVRMQTAAGKLDKTLAKGQGTLGQFFSAKFLKNSAAAASALSLAETRAAALQTQFVATGAAANGMRDAIAIRPLQAFNNAATVSAQKLAIHRSMLNQATTSMINFGKNTQWTGRQLMVGFTVPLTIFGAVAGKTFRELEKEAVNFKKVYGDAFTPPEEMQANLDAVKELAKEYTKYGIAVKDTIGLAAEAAAAGAQNQELIDATTQATRLATLGQMEQNEALKTTISLQNAFKLSGDELAKSVNFLNMVENQTVVTLQDLSGAIPRVAPVIKGLGGDVEDLAAFLAAMQEGGVSAAQGAQALKSGLASLINPTDKAKEKLQGMGISLDTIIQANRGDLMGTVQALADAFDTLDQFSRQQAIEEIFGKFQYARLAALFDNINKEGTQAARVLEMTGMSAAEMAASAEKELSAIEEAVGTQFTAAMEKLQLAIAPIGEMFTKLAIPVINFLSKIADAFNNLPDFAKKFIGLATVVVGLVIPAGTMFLGLLVNLVGTLTKFGAVTGSAFRGFLSGGIKGAFDAVSQSVNYMSLEQIDAATASQQLAGSTEAVNAALLGQVGASEGAQAAVMELAYAYEILTQQMRETAAMNELVFGTSAAAMGAAGTRGPRVRRNRGGTIPGSGNTDTVPAMLTPGEFVVNKQATQDNLPLLRQINESGKVPGYFAGGIVARLLSMFRRKPPINNQTIMPIVSKGSPWQQAEARRQQGRQNQQQRFLENDFNLSDISEPAKRRAWSLANELEITTNADTRGSVGFHSKYNQQLKDGNVDANPTARQLLDDLNDDTYDSFVVLRQQAQTWNSRNPNSTVNTDTIIKNFKRSLSGLEETKVNDTRIKLLYREAIEESGVNGRDFLDAIRKPAVIDAKMTLQDQEIGLRQKEYSARNVQQEFGSGFDRSENLIKADLLPDGRIRISRHIRKLTEKQKKDGIGTEVEEMAIISVGEKQYIKDGRNKANIWVNDDDGPVNLRLLRGELGSAPGADYSYKSVTGPGIKGVQFAHANKGGHIVPGVGNKDTVPAMLTPGEFVVNKKATQSNMALLKAINDGTIRGYAAGDVVGDKRNGFYAEGTNGMKSGPFPTRRMARKEARQIVRNLGISRSGGMGMMGGRAMGLSMLGGTAMMGGMMIPGVAQNQVASTAMMGGGMLLSMAPMLAGMGPVGLAIAGVTAAATAAGVALYKWRDGVDTASRKAAEFGANLGATANALNNMAALMGQQTPSQRRAQLTLNKEDKEILNEYAQEFQNMFSSEKGQAFIEDLKNSTSAERFKKLSDNLSYAIAAGMLDQTTAQAFAKGIAIEIGDAVLGTQVATRISEQGQGPESLINLAEKRISKSSDLMSNALNETTLTHEEASKTIGAATQIIQDFSNAEALAREQFAAGDIGYEELQLIIEKTTKAQSDYSEAIQFALDKTNDLGATMQAVIEQVSSAGIYTEDQVKELESITGRLRSGEPVTTEEIPQVVDQYTGPGMEMTAVTVEEVGRETAAKTGQASTIDQNELISAALGLQGEINFEDMKSILEEISSGAGELFDIYSAQIDLGKLPFEALRSTAASEAISSLITSGNESDVRDIAVNFESSGGDLISLLRLISSLPEDGTVRYDFLMNFDLLTPEQQNTMLSDSEKLASIFGDNFANSIRESSKYQEALEQGTTEAIVSDMEEAEKVFGKYATSIINYANITDTPLSRLTGYAKEISKIPQDLQFKLGIDITNREDLKQFGPLADDIANSASILLKLPEEINVKAFIEANTNKNGELASPEELANEVIKIRKAMADLDSTKPEIVKKAAVQIMVQEGMTQTDANTAFGKLLARMKDFNDFKVEDKVIVIQAYVELEQAIEALSALEESMAEFGGVGGGGALDRKANQLAKERVRNAIQILEAAQQTSRINLADSGTRTGPGGNGQKEKTLFQQLKEQAQASQKMLAGMSKLGNQRGFKKFISGPFAPEFLEYLRSQGEKGLKLIRGGLDKVKGAYANFVADRSAQLAAEAMALPFTLANQLQNQREDLDYRKSLVAEGRSIEEVEIIAEQTKAYRDQIQINKDIIRQERQKKKSERNTGRIKQLREENSLLQKATNSVEKFAKEQLDLNEESDQFTKFNTELGSLDDQVKAANYALELMSEGIAPSAAVAISQIAGAANYSTEELSKFVGLFEELEILTLAMQDPAQLRLQQLQGQENINRLKYEIELLENINKNETMSALYAEEKVDNHEDLLEVYERENELKSREIELRQRALEPIDEEITRLEEQKETIQETYDNQIEALDEIFEKEEKIIALKEKSLDVADALSSGDIAAAARAQMQLQSELAAQRREDQRSMLELKKQKEIENIDDKINKAKDRRKVIEEDIKRLQLEQRDIQDQIYNTQFFINEEAARLEDKYKLGNNQLAMLRAELELAEVDQRKLNAAIDEQNERLAAANRIKQQNATSYSAPAPAPAPAAPVPGVTTPGTLQQANIAAGKPVTVADTKAQTWYETKTPADSVIQSVVNRAAQGDTSGFRAREWAIIANNIGRAATVMYGGKIKQLMFGGSVNYRGSREAPPGFMYGGKMKKFASGSWVPGNGMLDSVPAMLTPGEFVVRKPVAETYGNFLQSLNGQVFPRVNFRQPMPNGSASESGSMYNYNVNVTLNGSDMNPDDVANAVMKKIKMTENTRVRGYNTRG